jgi:hypothetical protein
MKTKAVARGHGNGQNLDQSYVSYLNEKDCGTVVSKQDRCTNATAFDWLEERGLVLLTAKRLTNCSGFPSDEGRGRRLWNKLKNLCGMQPANHFEGCANEELYKLALDKIEWCGILHKSKSRAASYLCDAVRARHVCTGVPCSVPESTPLCASTVSTGTTPRSSSCRCRLLGCRATSVSRRYARALMSVASTLAKDRGRRVGTEGADRVADNANSAEPSRCAFGRKHLGLSRFGRSDSCHFVSCGSDLRCLHRGHPRCGRRRPSLICQHTCRAKLR